MTAGATAAGHDDKSAGPGGKCRCGCVPNILSLFEMAELRAKLRKEREQQQQAQRLQDVEKQQQPGSLP